MTNDNELISEVFYNRKSELYGDYKVIKFIEERGKSKVRYYMCKFRDTGNTVEASLKNILENKVVDIEENKRQTKKKVKSKKKEVSEIKYQAKTTVDFNYGEEIRLLSLDLATISSGISLSVNGKVIYYNYIYISDKENGLTKRINYMKKEIVKAILKYKPNVCVLEDVINKDIISTVALSKLSGVILDTLYEMGIHKVVKLQPRSWKISCDINQYKPKNEMYHENTREESKELTYLYVKDKMGIDIKKEFDNAPEEHKKKQIWTDLCDSLALNDTFYKNNINYV